MVSSSRFNRQPATVFQERLSKDDIRLLVNIIDIAVRHEMPQGTTATRIELLIGKLHRMEKQ